MLIIKTHYLDYVLYEIFDSDLRRVLLSTLTCWPPIYLSRVCKVTFRLLLIPHFLLEQAYHHSRRALTRCPMHLPKHSLSDGQWSRWNLENKKINQVQSKHLNSLILEVQCKHNYVCLSCKIYFAILWANNLTFILVVTFPLGMRDS